MENAVSALESPSGGRRGEFFGSELSLGRGFPLSDFIMFRVQVPDLPDEERPPRYYWRGHTYDYFYNNQWYTTGTSLVDYSPVNVIPAFTKPGLPVEEYDPAEFIFNTGDTTFSLLYAPAQPVWVSRPGTTRLLPAGEEEDIVSWFATPALLDGEAYQVFAILNNPNIQQLRQAGTAYPDWVANKYLQLPENFSTKIQDLALEITAGADTPYDKALAITTYLRNNIAYAPSIPNTPRNKDPLEWVLFEYKQGYCVYYSSTEILMLRSLGIPARMAVGFAQGELSHGSYVVRKLDAHAWPEVFFPGIGWVEFEPTASQLPLSRPLAPNTDAGDVPPPIQNFLELEDEPVQPSGQEIDLTETTAPSFQALNPILYLLPLFIAFIGLIIFLGRRYSLPTRIPVFVRTTIERSGMEIPNWVIYWERWVALSAVEKSFESINFGLRRLKQPVPIHATPIERARLLAGILPQIESYTKTLLDEHQTSLYTSRMADASLARRAAFQIRMQAIIAVVRRFWTGRYSANT